MIIRQARVEDNPALCRMELLAPQGADIRMAESRHNFFFKSELYPGSELLVLENEKQGTLVSVMGYAPVDMRIGGREVRGAYMFDWRTNPEAPRGIDRGVYLLWQELQSRARASGAAFIFGQVKSDNGRAISIYERLKTRVAGGRRFFTLPVFRHMSVDPKVVTHEKVDVSQELQLMQEEFRDHDMWPLAYPPQVLQRLFEHYLRAKVVLGPSSCKVWDFSSEYERVILDVPPFFRTVRPVTTALSRVIPLPRIPSPGDSIKTWMVSDLIVPEGYSPAPLLRAVNNLALEQGADYVIVSVDHATPNLLRAGRGAMVSLEYHLFVYDLAGRQEIGAPTYYDIRYA